MTTRRSRSLLASWTFLTVGGFGAAAVLLADLVRRILLIAPNRDVPVTVPFFHTTAAVAAGPGGADVPVAIAQGVIHVSGMPGITLASLVLGEILRTGLLVVPLVAFAVLCLRMARGRVFDRVNARLVSATGIAVVVVWGAAGLFTGMGVNGAFAALSDHGYDNAAFPIDYTGLAAGVAVLVVGVAFELGIRLQRDTEGLV
jgi:hypothetical protein